MDTLGKPMKRIRVEKDLDLLEKVSLTCSCVRAKTLGPQGGHQVLQCLICRQMCRHICPPSHYLELIPYVSPTSFRMHCIAVPLLVS